MWVEFTRRMRGHQAFIALVLLLIYAVQAFPHGHPEPHPTPPSHTTHHQPPHENADRKENPSGTSHHHHELTQHIEPHSIHRNLPDLKQVSRPALIQPCWEAPDADPVPLEAAARSGCSVRSPWIASPGPRAPPFAC